MAIGKIGILINDEGVTYKRQLNGLSRQQVTELIVAMEILVDDLKKIYKKCRKEI